jgi:beta-glucanase (GH16 family)
MEHVGFDPHTIHANIHTQAYNHVLRIHKGASITVPAPSTAFHLYAIEWFKDRIDFFVDDTKYFSFTNEGTGWEVWPFDKPHYLLINTAIGGSWGGLHGIDDTVFPQLLYIDYVRVYEAVP